ncbi:MAG: AAA-like domain-containing protein [Drouetiella hepatica Uher 2000/2452]|uniref:AAA-like domain-containing protein n=1 Tax=Drouetiella hepatica Uher 2000/2452 TaxID=904376 RepID=A0A951QBN3_9CYAN|nr:AAA-like domain-containing protein [Drouetiella hepatica Uher 2000/2452]
MRAINQTLQSRESLALEEITIVDRDEDKIAAIIEISRRIVLSRRSEDFKTILFLAADPRNSAPLRLDHEAREIEEVLRLSQKRNQFQLVQQWAVTARDVQRSLLDFKPNIVHFSGHGVGQEGLALEDPNVQVKLVSSEALAKLFKLFADRGVECVLLSACYFEVQAEAIVQHIPYVIGIKQALGKQAAREFATGFYDALGAGRDIPFAYEHGRSRISLEGQAAELTPVLLKRSESSPSLSILEETRSRALRGDLVLEQPEGQVGLESVFYVDRPPIERDCYEHILQPGALIRIQAPRQMGKSSLLLRVLQRAGGRSVSINFQLVDADILTNLDQFLQWFCASVTYRLNLPDRVDHYWQGQLGSKDKCTYYFKDYLLPQLTEGLTLGLDEVDELFQYRQVAADFFGLLRFWYEEAKNKPLWKRLRLVLVHSQEVYVPLNINQSPFNVGLPIELLELTPAQVQDLWHRHRLTWTAEQQQALMQMVGGHPYLVRMALYELAKGRLTLAEFLDIAPTESGLYGEHLRRHWLNLQEGVELVAATQRVVTAQHAVELDSTAAFKLRSIGLVKFQGNGVVPRCDLYRHYFSNHLQ